MRPSQRHFHGMEQGPDFDRARTQIATPFQYIDIALDTATANQVFNVSGDFLYLDASSTGTVTLELNNQYNDAAAPFQASAGFGLNALFKQLKISWTAQAGKKVRLMYSTGDRIVPTNSTTINGTATVVQTGNSYGATYKAQGALAANTPDTVFTAAANVNGAIVWDAAWFAYKAAAFNMGCFISKATAPASAIDGDVIVGINAPAATNGMPSAGRLLLPVKIAAGKGLYYFDSVAEDNGHRYCNYTLL